MAIHTIDIINVIINHLSHLQMAYILISRCAPKWDSGGAAWRVVVDDIVKYAGLILSINILIGLVIQ